MSLSYHVFFVCVLEFPEQNPKKGSVNATLFQ